MLEEADAPLPAAKRTSPLSYPGQHLHAFTVRRDGPINVLFCSSSSPSRPSSHCLLLLLLQLSARYAEEGIEFSNLCQSDQNALQADVRSQLYHATGHSAGVAAEWDELSITMQAYGGVTSVGLVRNDGKTANDDKKQVVSLIGGKGRGGGGRLA